MTIGEKIAKFRIDNNLTQKQLADICGFSQSALNFWENGKRQPKIEQLEKIADALNIPSFELMGDLETKRICKKIGNKVQNLRKNQGLTTKDLAKLSGIDETIIQCCEDGTDIIELETLKQIVVTLGASLFSIVDDWSIYPNRPDDFTWYAGNYSNLITAGEREQKYEENLLLADYRKLNIKGQSEARKRVNELTEIKKYTEIEDEFYE